MPRVSVLMPVHNTAPYLEEAVRSVLRQTFQDLEIIALDDGSTDGSPAILDRLAATDKRLRVMARENRGLVETRNELIAVAQSPYIAWMDSDDWATPDRIERQFNRFLCQPDLVCLGGCWLMIDPEGLPIRTHRFPVEHDEIVKDMETEIAIGFACSMMRTETVLQVGCFRHPFVISEDFDLCLRLSEVGKVANLPEVILHYRQHMASTVNSGRPRSYAYSALARELARERRTQGNDRLQRGEKVEIDFGREVPPRVNARQTYARWAWWSLQAGHLATARKYAFRILTQTPLSVEAWRLAYCVARGH